MKIDEIYVSSQQLGEMSGTVPAKSGYTPALQSTLEYSTTRVLPGYILLCGGH